MTALKGTALGILIAAVAVVAIPAAASASSASGPVRPCNGSVELCQKSLDQVVLPGSHNSMSASELDWFRPNQTLSIPNQLNLGARSLLIDTYYAKPRKLTNGETVLDKLSRSEGSSTGAEMYLCHQNCQWGNSRLIDEFTKIRDFLAANPREVMVIVNQDSITPADYARAAGESGLNDFIYEAETGSWPTLGEMVESGDRVLMLAEQQSDGVPWYHPAYSGILQETPYTFGSWAQLYVPEYQNHSCRPLRGGETGSLFLMNNWVTDGLNPPKLRDARMVNSKSSLVARARACAARRGSLPNILAVDFFETGDVVGAARELNGVSPASFLELSKPAAVRVKAGRKATLRMKVSNYGDAGAAGLRLCARAPSRFAAGTACRDIASLSPNTARQVRIRLRTRKSARGSASVRVSLRGAVTSLSTKARLRVKPLARAGRK